jgi:pimeloyl-ACP methyl ester carboxylesterase
LRAAAGTRRELARLGLGTAIALEAEAARRGHSETRRLDKEDAMPWQTATSEVPRATRSLAYAHETEAGDPVVCIHASASSSAQWTLLEDRLGDRYRPLAVDLHGAGRSPAWRGGRPLTLADEVALLEPALAATGARFHLIGHSYGGAVALKIALAHPHWVASLTVFEPVLFSLLMADDPGQPAAREIAAVRADTSAAADRGDLHGAGARFVDYWTGAGTWAAMSERRRAAIAAAMTGLKDQWHAVFEEPAPLAALGRLDMPALCLIGARSPESSRAVSRLLVKTLPRVMAVELAGVGHLGPVTHAERVNALIEQHLDGLARRF